MRGQIFTQVLVFFIAAFLFVLIVFFGYKAISGFGDKQELIAYTDLKLGIEAGIDQLKTNHGNVDTITIRSPAEEICFITAELPSDNVGKPILKPTFRAKTGNIILLKDGAIYNKFYSPDIIVVEDASVEPPQGTYCCYKTERAMKLRLEGYKGKAVISSWDPQLNPCDQ
ncbi:MAG: hypothetical protein QF486_06295 [Candidatus Woesearchaeota archaeon]|jgi:hypothetical protein|nr:hypothetical protein [Candidatus Woesearchaeota archaeon]MDP7180866.1 hypothetical protein [Candidatus Woesearchaeota archaeon]MDP7199196.1 hypothetical protein [Candidatus Woesearchaeota archaeon]MDP7467541.1 hypothetical protein [Candidatus Woesearchaeota archaeon]MDP7647023.1 hypothetical protein [Candidatus Woesearchaeota archaeon]